MKIIRYPGREQWKEITERPHLDHSQLQQTVSGVLNDPLNFAILIKF